MSPKNNYNIEGFFDYVVPPLEGLWNAEGDIINKDELSWISLIRLPDFIKESDVEWAKAFAAKKKKRTSPKYSFLGMTKGYAFNACTQGLTTTSPRL